MKYVFIWIDDTFRFLRRKPNDLFAFEDMLFMWAFYRRSDVMVRPRYLACETV